jgi:hypothetical protein
VRQARAVVSPVELPETQGGRDADDYLKKAQGLKG